MRFSIRHLTEYRYDAPVRLGAHRLRLTPRPQGVSDLRQDLRIDPPPVSRRESNDAQGNRVCDLEFAGSTTHLRIESRIEARSTRPPVPAVRLSALPLSPVPQQALWVNGPSAPEPICAFVRDIVRQAGGDPLRFLELLTRTLHGRIRHELRPTGYALDPVRTLQEGRGACRDLAMLFILCARNQGIPARFVSGYQAHAASGEALRHLHAWPEVSLPGLGWIGYDPTQGQGVGEDHLALCAAPDQLGTMPLEGSFRSNGRVTPQLSYHVEITTAP